jgi:HPt (histidine-containing phosphotransfer) domain-containing protein
LTSAAETTGLSRPAAAVDESVLAALLTELGDEGDDLLGDLVGSYLAEAADQVAEFVSAARLEDAQRVAAVAHSLRSASALLGVEPLAALLRQAEDRATMTVAGLADLADPVQDEFTRARTVLLRLASQPS